MISIPTYDLSEEQIQRLVDLIRFESIVGRSEMTQEEADEIAKDIKHSWWEQNRDRIEKMIAEAGNE